MEWDEILKRGEYSPEEPDKLVIQFTKFLKDQQTERILDLGCGAGRHLVYFAKQGFETHGIDVSKTGLQKAKNSLKAVKLNASLIKCDMKALPYIGDCFDAVISLYTTYHNTKQGIKDTIAETHRTLRKKGYLLLNFHSRRSGKFGKGIRIEEDTFMQDYGPEKGILHHFVDEDEIYELLKGFKVLELQPEEHEIEGYLRSHWMVLAVKD